ncbi:MAG: hypothetical protein U9Q15_00225 [Patescibacteria group bacterium]|nr:hypothetical protein [Patescibacteria group bacterium]
MKPKNSNIAFENEYMITDLDKKPITTIDGYDTSQILIDHIKDIDISAKKAVEDFLISPELDSCQIETRNK